MQLMCDGLRSAYRRSSTLILNDPFHSRTRPYDGTPSHGKIMGLKLAVEPRIHYQIQKQGLTCVIPYLANPKHSTSIFTIITNRRYVLVWWTGWCSKLRKMLVELGNGHICRLLTRNASEKSVKIVMEISLGPLKSSGMN